MSDKIDDYQPVPYGLGNPPGAEGLADWPSTSPSVPPVRWSDPPKQIDVPSVEATLAERGARYGDFTDHAAVAQALQDEMRSAPGWGNLDAVKRQALTVIADKIARVLTGDPNYADNWHDIQGYAKLVEDRL